MLVALLVLALIGLIVVVVMRAVWTKRPEHEPKTTSTSTKPPPSPDDRASPSTGPPAGSRADREEKGRP